VYLETDSGDRSPLLSQITAETAGDDYLARLPAVYARADAKSGFLRGWLEAFRAELGDRELDIATLPRRLDPATAPADHLPWLATWIACDLPVPGSGGASPRTLLQQMPHLHERRGTIAGLREMVRLYTGVHCQIFENFRQRALWMLGDGAGLGFDTGLLPSLPDSMAVPGPSLPDPALQGLSVKYFFDAAMATAAEGLGVDIDADGSFPSLPGILPVLESVPNAPSFDTMAALWTGQIRASVSELVTFYLAHRGGARLFVDDQLLVDAWSPPGTRTPRGSLPLVAGQWYPIRIEYWASPGDQRLQLSWSSPSQAQAIVPTEALYARIDDNIDPAARPHDGGADHLIVGEAVVGAHGPLAGADFGSPLFTDEADQFTVRVHARDIRAPGTLDAVRGVLDAEKPAHTDYHLCVLQPRFRVGMQARLGIDAIVSPPTPAGRLDEGLLGLDSRLGAAPEHDDGTLRVEETLRIGPNTRLR